MSSRKRKRERRALEDHVNLMRAVRARRTLDLAQHLSARPEVDQSESESVSSHGSGEKRAWTRWPLLEGDAHVPEWTLFDEVEDVVSRFLKADADALDREEALNEHDAVDDEPQVVVEGQRPAAALDFEPEPMEDGDVDLEAPSDGDGEDVDMEDGEAEADDFIEPDDDDDRDCMGSEDSSAPPLPLDALRDITDSTHAYLTRLLRTLALARPAVHSILLRRLAPFDWVSVLEMAGAHGLADVDTIQYVREVMEDIHGPAELKIIDRMRVVEAHRAELRAFAAAHDHIDDEEPMPRRKAAAEEVVSDSEAEDEALGDEVDEQGLVKKRAVTRSRELLEDDDDRPVRSREIISDSDISTADDDAPHRAKSLASRISEVMSETDVSMPDMRQESEPDPAPEAELVPEPEPEPEAEPIARRRPARRASTRYSRATSMSTDVAPGPSDSQDLSTPVATAPPSEDEVEQNPLAAGWRRGRHGDDGDDVEFNARRQRKRSLSRRVSLPRARSHSRGA